MYILLLYITLHWNEIVSTIPFAPSYSIMGRGKGHQYFDNTSYLFNFVNIRGRLDLAVLFTPSTANRQKRNQVRWNICAGVLRSTPSFEVVQTEQSRDLFQKRWRIIDCNMRKYFVTLDLFRSTPKCPVLLVYVAVLAYAEYSKNC